LPNSEITAYTWGLQFPFAVHFFFGGVTSDPLWSYGMKSGFAEKQFFKLRKNVFFAHAWTASNPRKIYIWIDLGTWKIVFPNSLMKTALARKKPWLESSPRPRYLSPTLCRLSSAALGKKAIFQAQIVFFLFALNDEMEWTLPAGIEGAQLGTAKKKNRALKNCFFGAALVKLRQVRLCKKNNCSGSLKKIACLLLHLPTPPRYLALARSKLRRCIQ